MGKISSSLGTSDINGPIGSVNALVQVFALGKYL